MKNNCESVVEGLMTLLADTYTVYLKTHNFHWNVTGPNFHALHGLFEAQYIELAEAVDEIAERIRTLGYPAPGSYAAFSEKTSIGERVDVPDADEMLGELSTDQATIVSQAKTVVEQAEAAGDQATVDLLVRRMEVHEKNGWMLRSSRAV